MRFSFERFVSFRRAIAILFACTLANTANAAFVGPRRALLASGCPASVKIAGTCPTLLGANFAEGVYWIPGLGLQPLSAILTTTRNSPETTLLPTSAAGASYQTFGANVAAINPGLGIQSFEQRTNSLLNSTAPATQTTGTLATGTFTLWVNGSGSATMSAGTATGCGTGTATNGSPVSFTISVTGTCTVTVTGSLNAFQLENGAFGTPLIVTFGSTVTRQADNHQFTNAVVAFLARAGTTTALIRYVQPPYASGSGSARQFGVIWTDTGNSRWNMRISNAAADSPAFVVGDGTTVSTVFDTTVLANTTNSVAWRWSTINADAALSLNGRTPIVAARRFAGSIVAPVYFGGNNGAGAVNATLSYFSLFSGAPSVQALSAP